MSRRRTLLFDPLESRELLSHMHHPMAHAHRGRPAAPAERRPLSFSGTLTLDNQATTTTTNQLGGYTSTVPFSGQLAGIGAVRGQWFESSDSMGNYQGPDTITVRGPQGAFTIAFSNASSGPAHKVGKSVYYRHVQHIISSSGAYAHSTETGSIDLNMNPSHTTVVSMTLNG